ncbi:response regulator [Desulfobulbus sp. F5]|nr:response regulator [Desulfobulbus sp. F5]
MELDEHPFVLAEAVEAAVRTVSVLSQEKGLDIFVDIAPSVPAMVDGDSLRFRQIILNLLSNAIKFSEKGPIRITVVPDKIGPETIAVRVAVIDRGIGVKADKISSIFSAFSQEDSSVSRKFGGTGLGLAICRQLCELMDGTISVQSEQGKGTTFTFVVIFGLTSQELPQKKVVASLEEIKLQPVRILLVEDNPANRFLLRVVLEKDQHQVIEAIDGVEALHVLLDDDRFDLILSDVQMPRLDGYSLTRLIRFCEQGEELDDNTSDKLEASLIDRLRRRLHGRHRLIIAMTANAMSGDQEKCFDAGMDDYLTKPIDKKQLACTLRRWLPAA